MESDQRLGRTPSVWLFIIGGCCLYVEVIGVTARWGEGTIAGLCAYTSKAFRKVSLSQVQTIFTLFFSLFHTACHFIENIASKMNRAHVTPILATMPGVRHEKNHLVWVERLRSEKKYNSIHKS